MKVLLRQLASGPRVTDDGFWDDLGRATIELGGMPDKGHEIHLSEPDLILEVVLEPKWFSLDETNPHGHAGCLFVETR